MKSSCLGENCLFIKRILVEVGIPLGCGMGGRRGDIFQMVSGLLSNVSDPRCMSPDPVVIAPFSFIGLK